MTGGVQEVRDGKMEEDSMEAERGDILREKEEQGDIKVQVLVQGKDNTQEALDSI